MEAGKCGSRWWVGEEWREGELKKLWLFVEQWPLLLYRGVCWSSWSQEWWDRDVNGFNETDFIQNFRMSRTAFNYICQCLSTRFSWKDTYLRGPIFLKKHAGVKLHWLTLSNQLSIAQPAWSSRSFARPCKYTMHTIQYIKITQGCYLWEVLQGLRMRWGFPQCAGAIDGSHISIIALEDN